MYLQSIKINLMHNESANDQPEYQIPDCTICLTQMTQNLVNLTCGHIFHASCIHQHLQYRKRCPNCQKPTETKQIRPIFFPLQKKISKTQTLQKQLENQKMQNEYKNKKISQLQFKLNQQQSIYLNTVFKGNIKQNQINHTNQIQQSTANSQDKSIDSVTLQLLQKNQNATQISGIEQDKWVLMCDKSNNFPKLQTINLWSNNITDRGLQALASNCHKFPNLQKLNLWCNKITGTGLQALADYGYKFPNLQEVHLHDNQITDSGLEALAKNGDKFPKLKVVDLGTNQIKSNGLQALASNAHKFSNLQTLGLNHNQVTDSGLQALVQNGHKFPKLQIVYLKNNPITSVGRQIPQKYKLNFSIWW